MDLTDKSPQIADIVVRPVEPETKSTTDMMLEYSTSLSYSFCMDNDPLFKRIKTKKQVIECFCK